jgi:hypothetical protein
MADYEPVDLSDIRNVEMTALSDTVVGTPHIDIDELTRPEVTSFRGLPFQFGGGRLISVGDSISIPIGKIASRVIVAHRVLKLPETAGAGAQVAEYGFHMEGGRVYAVPIRELFENWHMREPTNAVVSGNPTLAPRYEGPWDEMGKRQQEASQGPTLPFAFWTWQNPEPDNVIESLAVVPLEGFRTVIAAVTLSHVNEHPFSRQGRRATLIKLKEEEDASKSFDLEVEVDRGDATYVHPLPDESADEFLNDPYRGWGQAQNTKSSPSYVEISAIPSATVRIKRGDEELASVRWGDVENQGVVEVPKAQISLRDPGKNWVHVTVLDDDTGKPVPCRVHFRSPDGIPYQPYGHHNQANSNMNSFHADIGGDLRMGQITYAYIDGACQGWLPRGEVIVDVARGFEYEPLRESVTIVPGQRELTLRIKRWTDMNAQGWFSGDSHVHFVGAQGAHRESQGEDLNVVNLLQSQWGSLFTNTEDFTGEPSISRDGNNIVYVGQENRQHFYGHLILWGLKRPVMPWCTGEFGEAEVAGTMEATLSDWADQARAQGAYVVAPHFGGLNGETAALVATGRLQAVEMHRQSEKMHWEYYRSLNAGYRLPLLGGTDKMYSDVPVGLYRTYVQIPDDEEFTYDNWCRNVARGRTFHSGGPLIGLTVDGHEIGDTVRISGPGTVEIAAWAEGTIPIGTLQIVVNGDVVASTDSPGGTRRLELKDSVSVDRHSWIAARAGGTGYWPDGGNVTSSKGPSWSNHETAKKDVPNTHYDGWRRGHFAHTSPIYIAVGGDWWMFDEATARHMLTVFEGDKSYINNVVGQHPHGSVTHHHGEDDHIAYLERPFVEAREAVLKRMRDLGISP